MRRMFIAGFTLLALSASMRSVAQNLPQDVCRVEKGEIFIKIDLGWTDELRKNVAGMFGLDSLVMDAVTRELSSVSSDGVTWKVRKLGDRFVELSRPLNELTPAPDWRKDILMLEDKWLGKPAIADDQSAVYGVNHFARESVIQKDSGATLFFLRGHQEARQVNLSGTFNNWSTMMTSMSRVDSGWTATVTLKPGKYLYKFIVDGTWTSDPENLNRQKDGRKGYNSVFFRYNHRFFLKGFLESKKVILAGSFNNWNEKQLKMSQVAGGWALPLYLREGTHAYKFIIDGQWITDPASQVVRPDGKGNENSFLSIGDTMYFRLNGYTDADQVAVAGDFNGWNPGELFMMKTFRGWLLPYVLAAGNYEYKFVVDGKWMTDPANPFTIGSGDYTNSILAVHPNHTFVLRKFPQAKMVIVTGSFNNWNTKAYEMKLKEGDWTFPMYLSPGKYTYKFIVDGVWMIDPANLLWEENEVGTGNSVLWIGQ